MYILTLECIETHGYIYFLNMFVLGVLMMIYSIALIKLLIRQPLTINNDIGKHSRRRGPQVGAVSVLQAGNVRQGPQVKVQPRPECGAQD